MDLLHIPGDTGNGWRIRKFGEFANKVRAVDPLTLEAYYQRHKLSLDDTLYLFWLLSSTYSEITAIVIYEQIPRWKDLTENDIDAYWEQNKPMLKFGSSRRYAKSMNWFPYLLKDFLSFTQKNPSNWFKSMIRGKSPENAYDALYRFLINQKYMGRFSVELFLLNFTYFFKDKIWGIRLQENITFEWSQYSNETSGLLNLFYQDELADEFDLTHKISNETCKFLDKANIALQKYLLKEYGEYDASPLIYMPRICTFRNFCKQNRYVGFHHDRQLEFILNYQKHLGNTPLIKELFEIRKSIFPNSLLGELNGWNGIRPEKKKMFITTGLTGAEEV